MKSIQPEKLRQESKAKGLLVQSAVEPLKGQRQKVKPTPTLPPTVCVVRLVFLGTP